MIKPINFLGRIYTPRPITLGQPNPSSSQIRAPTSGPPGSVSWVIWVPLVIRSLPLPRPCYSGVWALVVIPFFTSGERTPNHNDPTEARRWLEPNARRVLATASLLRI